jgi:hypothetical protein
VGVTVTTQSLQRRWFSLDDAPLSRINLTAVLALTLVVVVIFGIALWQRTEVGGDFTEYEGLSRQLLETGDLTGLWPNFLFELVTIAVFLALPRVDMDASGYIAVMLFYVFLSTTLYFALRAMLGNPTTFRRAALYVVVSLALMIVTPITIFTWQTQNLNFGYILQTVYHNPTINLLKPFALLQFLYAVTAFVRPQMNRSMGAVVLCAIITVLSAMAKPSYLLCLLPAVGLFTLYKLLRRQPFNWQIIVFGIGVPAVAALAVGYLATYTESASEDSRIIFAPFYYMSTRPHAEPLALKFVMSILFPVVVYALYFQQARRDTLLNFAWVGFLVGAFLTYFMAESGRRLDHGNFIWSGQITLFLLFVASVVFILRMELSTGRVSRRLLICGVVFALHLVSGLLWYAVYAGETLAGVDPNLWR